MLHHIFAVVVGLGNIIIKYVYMIECTVFYITHTIGVYRSSTTSSIRLHWNHHQSPSDLPVMTNGFSIHMYAYTHVGGGGSDAKTPMPPTQQPQHQQQIDSRLNDPTESTSQICVSERVEFSNQSQSILFWRAIQPCRHTHTFDVHMWMDAVPLSGDAAATTILLLVLL